MPIVVVQEKCTGCEECKNTCPYDAIVMKDGRAFINEYCQLCNACLSVCPEGAIVQTESAEAGAQMADNKEELEKYKGVWIFAEQRKGKPAPVSYELLGAGKRLAKELATELSA